MTPEQIENRNRILALAREKAKIAKQANAQDRNEVKDLEKKLVEKQKKDKVEKLKAELAPKEEVKVEEKEDDEPPKKQKAKPKKIVEESSSDDEVVVKKKKKKAVRKQIILVQSSDEDDDKVYVRRIKKSEFLQQNNITPIEQPIARPPQVRQIRNPLKQF
jgi:hypothetical protein